MLNFSNLLKSNFGDSVTPSTSPLEPRLKSGQDAATALPAPQTFKTPVGWQRVPREKDPRKPNYEMIKDARKGILSGFLRSGKILRASDFVGLANPKTAIITLDKIYEFETRYLAAIDDQPISRPPLSSMVPFKKVAEDGADDGKTLRSLFFISLAHDELPSFHFWTKQGDLDPVTAGKPIDWGEHFDKNPPSPTTTAKITMLENERKEKAQRGAEEQQNTQNGQPLGFLDRYNDINLPGLGIEPSQGRPTDNNIDSILQTTAAPVIAQAPFEAEVLLQFNRGGMYLREFTHKALYAMACWLIENEEEDEDDEADKGPAEHRDMFLDILEPGKELREEKIASVSRVSNRNFQDNIKPNFGRPESKFRVRSTRYQSWWNQSSDFDSGGVGDLKYDLKLVRPNVGYCYCSANWHITGYLELNSLRFEKALEFLFDWESSAYPKSNHVSLDIPEHGSFDLDRNSDVVVDALIQKIFADLSATPVEKDSRPVEIFVRDIVEDVTDGSDFLGTSSPRHGNFNYQKGTEVADVLQTQSGAGLHTDQGSMIASDIHDQPPSDILGSSNAGQFRPPSIFPPLPTNSEINKLQEQLEFAEASLVETDDLLERLRIAEERLSEMSGLQERLQASEARAKLRCTCPFCAQDWAGATKEQQQDHLKLHQKNILHQPAPQKCPQPNCAAWLGENQGDSTFEAIAIHLRTHIIEEHAEDGICDYPRCHTNMYAMTAEQQEEHESIHRDNEESDMKRDLGKDQDENLAETAMERDQLQQQVRHLQDAVNERDRLQEELVDIKEERDSFKERAVELERRLKAISDPNKGMQAKALGPETEMDGEGTRTKGLGPETEVGEDTKPRSQPEALKKLRYCNICLNSVDKLSANAKTKHADKCETSVSEFILLTPAEAKAEREKRNNSRDVVRPQAQKGMEEEVFNTGKKRKQKASAKAGPSESQQDEAEDTNTAQQPEASKATGRKTRKHKIDTFKPPREDESDEDLESPKKKPKLKAKAAKVDKTETAPTRRSARSKGVYEPPDDKEEEGKGQEEADDKPSSSAKGGKRKKRAAAVTTASKKAKTKK